MKHEDLTEAARHLYNQGRFKDARKTYSQALDAAITESATEIERAAIKLELGKCCRLLAEYEQARTLLSDAMAVFESAGEAARYALCINFLALVLKDLAEYDESGQLLDKALVIAEKTHGPSHQDIAEILNNIGLLQWRLSKDENAMAYYEKALAMQCTAGGEETQLYGEIVDNIGVSLQRLGRYEEAVEKHKSSLRIREKCLGQNHPDIGYSLLNIGTAQSRMGDSSQVESLAKRAIACFERGFGDCPDTAVAFSNLGSFYLEQFRLDEALDCFKRSLSIKESVLGANHPDLAIINHNMASVYKLKNNNAEAKQYSDRACLLLKANMEREGGANIETIITLSDTLHTNGNEQEAIDLLTEQLAALENSGDGRYKRVLEMLGTLHTMSAPESAKEYISKLLRIQKRELGPKHPTVAKTLRSLANAFAMQSDNTTSQFLTNQAKAIEFKHGLEDPDAKAIIALMGGALGGDGENRIDKQDGIGTQIMITMLRLQGKDDEADRIEQEQQQKTKDKLGAGSAEYANHLRTVALGSDYEKSIQMLEEVLAIQEENPDITLEDKLKTRTYMAMPLMFTGQYEKAEKLLLETLEYEKQLRGEHHWLLGGTLSNLVAVYEKLQKPVETEIYKKQLNDLSAPTPEEEEERQRQVYREIEKQLSSSIAGMGAVFQGFDNFLGTNQNSAPEDETREI